MTGETTQPPKEEHIRTPQPDPVAAEEPARSGGPSPKKKGMGVGYKIKQQIPLQLMMLPGAVLLVIFCVLPMIGMWMAFSKYAPTDRGYFYSLFHSEFVGFGFFGQLFNRPDFGRVVWNTVYISFVKIVLLIVLGVGLALLINEVGMRGYKKTVQTIVFIPYFLAWTILSSVIIDLLSIGGPINNFIEALGGEPVSFLASNTWFRPVLFVTEMWKSLGYQAIYFLAAIAQVDPNLYEAAKIDGAGRTRQCFSVTLPCIMPIIILMSVLNLGNIMSAGFDQVLSLYNEMVYDTGDILDTMAYRIGIRGNSVYRYSIGTAIGVFKSIISCGFFGIGYFVAAKKFNYKVF